MEFTLFFVLLSFHIFTVVSKPLLAQVVEELDSTYDFIVVGGGLSGLTVADRLSENPGSTSSAKQSKSYLCSIH